MERADGAVFLAEFKNGALDGLAKKAGDELFGSRFVFLSPDGTGEAWLAIKAPAQKGFSAGAGLADGGGFINQQRWPTGVFEREHELRLHYLCCNARTSLNLNRLSEVEV